MILHDLALPPGHLGHPDLLADHRRTGRDIPKVLLDFFMDGLHVNVPGNRDHRIGGTVVASEPLMDIFHSG